jgi:hypothetical protein
LNAIQSIKKDHEIKDLFFWSFSNEGEKLANKVSELTGLPLHKRQ